MKVLTGKFEDVKAAINAAHLETLDMKELGDNTVEIELVNMGIEWSWIREKIKPFNVILKTKH